MISDKSFALWKAIVLFVVLVLFVVGFYSFYDASSFYQYAFSIFSIIVSFYFCYLLFRFKKEDFKK